MFQCSSASRKFLNRNRHIYALYASLRFSALQRAENSSIGIGAVKGRTLQQVSVLFSEPKIPQFSVRRDSAMCDLGFSALQRAENSSIRRSPTPPASRACFSALQRAENSSIRSRRKNSAAAGGVSVLFSEPKIPQLSAGLLHHPRPSRFQCSSASRKFLNCMCGTTRRL